MFMANEQSIETVLALLERELRSQREQMSEIREEMRGLRQDVSELKTQAARWKGGFGVVLAIGALFGWLISVLTPFLKGV